MDCDKSLTSGEQLACKWQWVVKTMATVASLHPKMRVDAVYSVSSHLFTPPNWILIRFVVPA